MASVRLNFVKPDTENLAKLLIYECSTKDGTYDLIEVVNIIGTHPDYISFYTTNQASDVNDWFVIEWEDDKGARSPRSNPIQGNTKTVPGEVTARVLLRDPSIEEGVAVEDAEIVISSYFLVDDPYTLDPVTLTYAEWGGLTYLTMAQIYLTEILVESSVQGYTAGIVAQQQGNSQRSLDTVQKIIDMANKLLNRNYSVILLMPDYDPVRGSFITGIDESRLLVELV